MSHPNIEATYGLSPAQEGMLFHSVLEADAGFYVTQLVCEVRNAEVELLVRAWQEVVDRHTIFRTAFAWKGVQKPLQVVGKRVTLPVVQEDWRSRTAEARAMALEAWLEADRRQGFDLARAPLMRLALLRTGEAEWLFVWSHHHVLLDGWSLPRVLREVGEIYAAGRRGARAALSVPRPYQEYITWLGRQDLRAAESFWREMLEDAPEGRALVERSKTAKHDSRGVKPLPQLTEVAAMLTAGETAALQTLARAERLTLNTVVQGVWARVLAAETGTDDVVYGITVSGRPAELPGVEEMIGLFINTLPMRVRIEPGVTTARWLADLQARLTELRNFEHTPLVRVNGWAGKPSGQPLFEALFVFENYPVGELPAQARGGADFEIVAPRVLEKTNYPLTVAVAPGTQLALKVAFDPARYDRATVERMVERFVRGLRSLPHAIARPVGEWSLLAEAECAQLAAWGRAAQPTAVTLVPEAVGARAARMPDSIALSQGAEKVTYARMLARADEMAARLLAAGVKADEPVGILLERSTRQVSVLLGVWQAGAAYAPLDAEAPAERLRALVVDNGLKVIVTEGALQARVPDVAGVTVVEIDATDGCGGTDLMTRGSLEHGSGAPGHFQSPASRLLHGGTAARVKIHHEQLAYVLFTSGSTGRPKGVAISHGALANHMAWFNVAHAFSAEDVVLQKTPFTFDASVWEFWAPLMTGGRLELAAPGGHRDPAYLAKTIREAGVTVLQVVPSLLAVLVGEPELTKCATLRAVFAGGEALTPAVRDAFRAVCSCPLVNLYGPTETTIECATWTCGADDGDGATVPIGRPAPGCALHVLDAQLQPLPSGVAGELHVGGEQLARGYWVQPGLTAERFVPDPFSSEPGARLYRTGDLARWRADGVLEFLGRNDTQVKVRGHRIELSEVEAVLAVLPGVQQAVAAVREGALVGYVQWPDAPAEWEQGAKEALARRVPGHLVPSRWVKIEEWPRLPSGKIDRRALSSPDTMRDAERAFVVPRTADEQALAAIWAGVLGVAQVGATDDFFALGGHSLSAMQVMARVRRELQVELPMRALFEAPTVEAFARVVSAKREPVLEETTL